MPRCLFTDDLPFPATRFFVGKDQLARLWAVVVQVVVLGKPTFKRLAFPVDEAHKTVTIIDDLPSSATRFFVGKDQLARLWAVVD